MVCSQTLRSLPHPPYHRLVAITQVLGRCATRFELHFVLLIHRLSRCVFAGIHALLDAYGVIPLRESPMAISGKLLCYFRELNNSTEVGAAVTGKVLPFWSWMFLGVTNRRKSASIRCICTTEPKVVFSSDERCGAAMNALRLTI